MPETAVGSATADVVARDPVAISASLPRLLTPQDKSRLLLEFIHAHGNSGGMSVEVFPDAWIAVGAVPRRVNIPEGGALRLPLDITAREIGDNKITVQLTTPQGDILERLLQMPVCIHEPEVATTRRFSFGTGETFTFDATVLTGLLSGTTSAKLTAGALSRFDVPGLLRQLDRYPYDCTEQIISWRGKPLTVHLGCGGRIPVPSGLMPTRATFYGPRRHGVMMYRHVPWRWHWKACEIASTSPLILITEVRHIAYALLVLARVEAAQMADLRYYADIKAGAFATPMTVAELGAALAAYGDPARVDLMFARAGALLLKSTDRKRWRDDFGSDLRDRAVFLTLAAEVGSEAIDPRSGTGCPCLPRAGQCREPQND